MATNQPELDDLLKQFVASAYFPKFESILSGDDVLGRNVRGILGELGITQQDLQLIDNGRPMLKEGMKKIARRNKCTITLGDLSSAVESRRRGDARRIILKFLNKRVKSKSRWHLKDIFGSRKSHMFEDDNASLSSETTMHSAASVLSIASTATVQSDSPSSLRCQDWLSTCQQEDPGVEEELCVKEESIKQRANVSSSREMQACNLQQQFKGFEDCNNNMAQISSGVVVIAHDDQGKDCKNGIWVTEYLKSKNFQASLLDLTSTDVMMSLENAGKIVVVLTPQLAALVRQLSAMPNIPSQGYEFDAMCGSIKYLLRENFFRLRSPRIVLVSFHKPSEYGEIPIMLKSNVYNMNDDKSRKDLQFRLKGEERLKLSALGTRVKITPKVFSARSCKVSDTAVES